MLHHVGGFFLVLDRGGRSRTVVAMTPQAIADLAHLRRARDRIDRDYAQPLDVPAMARVALMSPAHFSRTTFRKLSSTG